MRETPPGRTFAILNFLADRLPALMLFLCACLSLVTWYGGEELVWGDDATHPMSLGEISAYFQVPDSGLGAPDTRKLPFVLPVGAVLAAWRELGIPYDLRFVQPIVVVGLLSIAGWSSLFLVRTLFPQVSKLAAFGAALFYMFNLYSLTTIWSSMSYLSFHYAWLPLILTVWTIVLTRDVSRWFVPAAAALWALTLTPAYITTPLVVTDSLLFASVVVFAAVRRRRARLSSIAALTRGLSLYAVWLVLNLFWIVPVATNAGAETTRGLAVGDPLRLFALNSAPFVEAIRLAGYWGVSATGGGSYYFPWYGYFASIGKPAAFATPILALIGLTAIVARRRLPQWWSPGQALSEPAASSLKFFTIMLFAALVLMAGANSPFATIKESIVETFGLTGPFRSVYQRFGVYAALFYIPLVAVGIWVLQGAWPNARLGGLISRGAAIVAIVGVAVVPALPLWTGDAFDRSGSNASRRITVPDDYRRLAGILDEAPGDYNVVVVPYGGLLGVSLLNWAGGNEGYQGVEPLGLLTRRPILTNDATAPHVRPLVRQVTLGGLRALRALQLLNARYVVLHVDANTDQLANQGRWLGLEIDVIDNRLAELPNVHVVFASKFLRAYSWTGWKPHRFFAVRPADTSKPQEASAFSQAVRRRPLPYRVVGRGRFVLDTTSLRRDEVVVMNQPFDPAWRADGQRPINVRPGLTAFKIDRQASVVVSNNLDGTFRLLLGVVPVVLALCAVSLGWAFRTRRRTAGE